MASGNDFIEALKAAVAPRTITNIKGQSDGVIVTLSDGTKVTAERKVIATLRDDDEIAAYVARVIS